MPVTGRGKRSGRRKHSFGGCRTCRRRHVKCDQIRPACLACRAINVTCEGYDDGKVRWLPPATLSSEGAGQLEQEAASESTTRHHLFSVSSRASMSTSLRQCFTSSSVDESLAHIDARTRELQADEDHISIGPFGVLNMAASGVDSNENDAPSIPVIDSEASGDAPMDEQNTESSEMANLPNLAPPIVDWFDPILGLNDSLQWSDLFSLDFDIGNGLLVPQSSTNYHEQGLGMIPLDTETTFDDVFRAQIPLSSNDLLGSASNQEVGETLVLEPAPESEQHKIYLAEVESAAEAQLLLKHFHDSVIPQWSFMPSNTKSPWYIFQLSEAVRTLSELTFLHTGTIKHANAANLYGILACSAYHLSIQAPDQTAKEPSYWTALFIRLRSQANIHMQFSLRGELKGPVKAKYKDQLMAMLAMLASATISGHHEDSRRYIIDAERLVRTRGLAKRQISRRCRFLHHVYTWIRVVGESTYVLLDYTHLGPVIDNMSAAYREGELYASPDQTERPSYRNNARLDDFLRLEPHQSDSDLDIEELKQGDTGLHDIHLNDSRRYHGTMYNEIYGISETWLSLVSQTTRLANILDASKCGKNTDGQFLEFLNKRASRLEHSICSWALKDPAEEAGGSETATSTRPVNYHMLQAMNSALVILFYRRIRKVNPLILQGHVTSVVQSLRDFDAALVSEGLVGPGSAWPAFIAGCEALSRQNRTLLMAWLDQGWEKCHLETFNLAMGVMNEVWRRHDERTQLLDPGSGGSNQSRSSTLPSNQHTWVEVCREQGMWVPLY